MNSGIIISVYNKEKEINEGYLEQFIQICKNVHVCFVNNGSTDGTLQSLKYFQKKFPKKMSIVSIRNNKGNDSAVKVGFRYLLNNMDLTKVSFSNQLNFKELKMFLELSNKLMLEP